MKTTLNKILYKLAETELANSKLTGINEQSSNLWQRIKSKFKRNKYDYTPGVSVAMDPFESGTQEDEVTVSSFKLDPPMINAKINSKWGKWRKTHRHLGIDMATPVGTPVYTVRPGTVVFIGDQPLGAGDYVITKHEPIVLEDGVKLGETFYALYAHLSDIRVSKGDIVDWGTIIGKSGGAYKAPGAGNSEGPHLHFEIKTSAYKGSIDPEKFYKKYGQQLENTMLHTPDVDTQFDKSADNIVNPKKTSTETEFDKDAAAVVTDSNVIIPGESNLDGFYVYELPKDDTYLYGVPMPTRTDLTYGWWFANVNKEAPEWQYLKSRLSAANYNKAVGKLNELYPNAIDSDRLAAAEIPQPVRNTNTTKQSQTTKPKSETTPTPTIFSKLNNTSKYNPASILKTNKVTLYSLIGNKFTKQYNSEIDNADRIQYIGHDSKNQYMHIFLISTADDPTSNKKWWINVKDIKLSQKTKF